MTRQRALPSLGFVWLASTIVAAACAALWLLQPFWFEEQGSARARKQADYRTQLIREATDAQQPEQVLSLLEECLQRALDGNSALLFFVLEALHEHELLPDDHNCHRLDDARGWVMRRSSPTTGTATVVVVHNDQSSPQAFATTWRRSEDVAVTAVSDRPPQPLAFVDGTAAVTIGEIAADATGILALLAPGGAEVELVRIKRAEQP